MTRMPLLVKVLTTVAWIGLAAMLVWWLLPGL